MIVELDQKEVDSLLGFCRNRAVNSNNYEEVYMFVKLVDKLTKKDTSKEEPVKTEIQLQKYTDIPLTHYYTTEAKRRYNIQRLHSKDGHLICRGRPLKLTIPQIMHLKEIMNDKHYHLRTPNDWDRLGKKFDITWMALQRYAYNIDIGTFEKWIDKFLKKHESQSTLEEVKK